MKEVKKAYERFQILRRNKDQELTKVTYSSLDKYNQSPYLQKVIANTHKRITHRSITPNKAHEAGPLSAELRQETQPKHQLPKITTPIKYKEGQVISHFQSESETIQSSLGHVKQIAGTHSATLEVNTTKKAKLQPLTKSQKINYVCKTKAGTTGKQPKTNQDIAIAEVRFPYGIKLFSVCDGHGLNGHLVSAFIKSHLIKNLNGSLNKLIKAPSHQDLKNIVNNELAKTNHQLLDSDINTELSGSTVVVVVIYQHKILTFNVGDSRAILVKQLPPGPPIQQSQQEEETEKIIEKKNDLSDGFKFNSKTTCEWKVIQLTIDQKPDRPDEHERVIQNGGRIFSQKNQKGEDLGPLRVWMKDLMMPGLAMTRSFGDKAGLKAGTTGAAEILEFDIGEEDKFIVVASDGIWQYLQNEEVMELIVPLYLKGDLQTAGQRLVRIATQIWHKVSLSRDDITAIIISLHAPMK